MTYSCPYKGCGRTFDRYSGLTIHINRGHPKESFSSVLGKRKRQIEQFEEEEKKRQLAPRQRSVEVSADALQVLC